MQNSVWLPLVLQATFFVVLVLEFILPSAGVLTAISVAALVASWWLIIQSSVPWLFNFVLIADILLIPVTLYVGFRLMLKSPLSNRHDLSDQGFLTQVNLPEHLMGMTATTVSQLKPTGKVELEGEIYDASSMGSYIEPRTLVRVVSVTQNRLTVEPITETDL